MFAYFDDKVLGLKLWYHGFKIKAYPIVAARHYGSASFGKISPKKIYLTTRNFLVLCKVAKNLRYKPLILTGYPLRRLVEVLLQPKHMSEYNVALYSFIRALLQVNKCRAFIDYNLDLNKVPLMKLNLAKAFKNILCKLENR